MKWLELRVPPPIVGVAFGAAMYALARLAPKLSFRLPGGTIIAVVLVALGAAVSIAGVAAFRRQGTTVNPLNPGATSSVVSSGIYGVSRNPMYLGLLIVLAGWAAYLSHAGAALLVPAFAAYLTLFQIKPEERVLREKFGPEFGAYMARVRRWV